MIVDISTALSSCALVESDVFTEFHVRSDTDDTASVLAVMGPAGRAADDAEHVWVALDWLVETAAGGDGWQSGFDSMMQYATSKGWTNETGTHLRAHIELRP